MKKEIHPKYAKSVITCACGNVIETRSIKPEMRIEICSNCHPVFTGKQKYVDTEGRLERFQAMFSASLEKGKTKKDKKVRVRRKKVSMDIKNIIADQEKRKNERQALKKKKEIKKNEEEAKSVKVVKKAVKAKEKKKDL